MREMELLCEAKQPTSVECGGSCDAGIVEALKDPWSRKLARASSWRPVEYQKASRRCRVEKWRPIPTDRIHDAKKGVAHRPYAPMAAGGRRRMSSALPGVRKKPVFHSILHSPSPVSSHLSAVPAAYGPTVLVGLYLPRQDSGSTDEKKNCPQGRQALAETPGSQSSKFKSI